MLQNEYVTWSRFDPHAGAYRTLLDERSAAIARHLGIGKAQDRPDLIAQEQDRDGEQDDAENGEREGAKMDRKPHMIPPEATLERSALGGC